MWRALQRRTMTIERASVAQFGTYVFFLLLFAGDSANLSAGDAVNVSGDGAAPSAVIIDLLDPPAGSVTPDTRPATDPMKAHDRTVDISIPSPTQFTWSVRGNQGPLEYTVSFSEDGAFADAGLVYSGCTDTMLSIWNLKINAPYYWKVSAKDGQGGVWNSPVRTFTTADAWPRMICIDGTTNVRDIGGRATMQGLVVRQGIFYRSAELNQNFPLTEKGVDQLMRLGIVCEIDMRNKQEKASPSLPASIRYVHPITDSGVEIIKYKDGLVNTPGLYRDVFKIMADERNYPMICHCLAGSDRTGTVAALLEGILENSERQMAEDFQWSSLSVYGVRDSASSDWRNTIAYIKSFDAKNASVQLGAWLYLQSIGMTADELMAIRKLFLNDERKPFSGIAYNNIRRAARPSSRWAVRKCFINSSPGSILIEKGVNRIALFSLSGELTFEFRRENSGSEMRLLAPAAARGVYICRFRSETPVR